MHLLFSSSLDSDYIRPFFLKQTFCFFCMCVCYIYLILIKVKLWNISIEKKSHGHKLRFYVSYQYSWWRKICCKIEPDKITLGSRFSKVIDIIICLFQNVKDKELQDKLLSGCEEGLEVQNTVTVYLSFLVGMFKENIYYFIMNNLSFVL